MEKYFEAIPKAMRDVTAELIRSTEMHGPFNSAHEGYSVILEELDELWEEIKKHKRDPGRIRREATQVAAMGARFLIDVCGKLDALPKGQK
jgi:hypothetical protein